MLCKGRKAGVVIFMEMHTMESVKTKYKFPYIIEEDEDGFYATCPALKGCSTQGDTCEEALANIKDAIWLCLKVMEDDGEKISEPKASDLPTVEVTI